MSRRYRDLGVRPPAVEGLEPRTLLSGNVAVSVVGGSLVVVGDNAANTITLTKDNSTNVVTVTPNGTTSINGGTAGVAATFNSVTGDLLFNMKDGDDAVTVTGRDNSGTSEPFAVGSGRRSIFAQMGGDNDTLSVAGVYARNVTMLGGTGINSLRLTALNPDNAVGGAVDIGSTILGNVYFQGGQSDDSAVISGSTIGGNVTLDFLNGFMLASIFDAFKGSDTNIDLTIGGNVTVSTIGDGQRSVLLGQAATGVGKITIGGRFLLNATNGLGGLTAIATVPTTIERGLVVVQRAGAFTVSLTDTKVTGGVNLNLGAGSDTVTLNGVDFVNSTIISTGSGLDTLTVTSGTANPTSTFGGVFVASLGLDDDAFVLNNATFNSVFLADGNGGTNTLTKTDATLTFAKASTFLHFVV